VLLEEAGGVTHQALAVVQVRHFAPSPSTETCTLLLVTTLGSLVSQQ